MGLGEVPFQHSVRGRDFFDRTMPELVKQLSRLNDNLEKKASAVGPEREAINRIVSVLYRDENDKLDMNKQWDPDTIDKVADIIQPFIKD